jgi:Helix-turn-helix domain
VSDWMSVKQVAQEFDIGAATVAGWLRRGWLKGVKVGGWWSIDPESVAELKPKIQPKWSRGRGTMNPQAPCGTVSAHHRHRRRGEPQDAACRAAWAAYVADLRRERRLLEES